MDDDAAPALRAPTRGGPVPEAMQRARSHLSPFLESPRPWLVIARNSIPAIGVVFFGWSAALAMFEIWFDGVASLAAMLALQGRAFRRLEPGPQQGLGGTAYAKP